MHVTYSNIYHRLITYMKRDIFLTTIGIHILYTNYIFYISLTKK